MFDVRLDAKVHRNCDGLARRDFLRVGAIAPFGLSLANALAADEKKKARAKSVLLVFLGGGLSHHDSLWDPLESTCRHASLSIL